MCRSCKTNIARSEDDELVLALFRDQEDETEAVSAEDRTEPSVEESGDEEEDSEDEGDIETEGDFDDETDEIAAMDAMPMDDFFIAPELQEEMDGQEMDGQDTADPDTDEAEEFEFEVSDLDQDSDSDEDMQFSDPF